MKLGELYIDLGVNSGNAFNTLAGFAFKFNQVVEAAKTVSVYLDEMFGKSSKYAYDMKILSQASSVPVKTLQAMNIAARNSNTSIQNMVGHIKKLNEGILAFRRGDGSLLNQLTPLGITSNDILQAKSGYDLMDKVVRRIQDIPDEFVRTSFLSSFMPIEDFNAYLDLLNNKEIYERRAENLTKEEINSLTRLYEINKAIDQQSEDRYNKFVAKMSPMFVEFKTKIADIKTGFYETIESADSFGEAIGNAVDYSIDKLNELWTNIANSIDESGGLATFGTFLGRLVRGIAEVIIDAVRGASALGTILNQLSELDWKGAKQTAKDFYNGSFLKKDLSRWFGGETTTKETPKPSSELARRQRIVADVFRKAGFDEDSIRAFVGNLTYESGGGLNPFENTGDKGRAFGIAQWQRGGRADKLLKRMSGVTDVDTALKIQAQYAVDEVMNSPEFKGLRPENFNRLSYEQKVDKVLNEFEAPHKMYRRGGLKSSFEARRDIGLQSDVLEGGVVSGVAGNYTSTVNIYGVEQDRLPAVSGEAIKDARPTQIRQANLGA